MVKSNSKAKTNEHPDALTAHLYDLKENAGRWHTTLCSDFLDEHETAAMRRLFPPDEHTVYDGGYPDARKQKVVFSYEEGPQADIVCLTARLDQRFRKISHRDVLGALMHLSIERSAFGDFWIEENRLILYTSEKMADFLIDHLTRINQLSITLEKTEERPAQQFRFREFQSVIASDRLDAVVSGITHVSRSAAKQMIRASLISVNHEVCEMPDYRVDENTVISVRGYGRYVYMGNDHKTKSDRVVGVFRQFI